MCIRMYKRVSSNFHGDFMIFPYISIYFHIYPCPLPEISQFSARALEDAGTWRSWDQDVHHLWPSSFAPLGSATRIEMGELIPKISCFNMFYMISHCFMAISWLSCPRNSWILIYYDFWFLTFHRPLILMSTKHNKALLGNHCVHWAIDVAGASFHWDFSHETWVLKSKMKFFQSGSPDLQCLCLSVYLGFDQQKKGHMVWDSISRIAWPCPKSRVKGYPEELDLEDSASVDIGSWKLSSLRSCGFSAGNNMWFIFFTIFLKSCTILYLCWFQYIFRNYKHTLWISLTFALHFLGWLQ